VGRPRTDAIIGALPPDLRKQVEVADEALNKVKASAPRPPDSADVVVSTLAAEMHAAALDKSSTFDLQTACAEAGIENDAAALAYEVGRRAQQAAAGHVVAVLRTVIPRAMDAWTSEANDLLEDVRKALAGKPSLGDELAELRAGGARAKRAATLTGLYEQLDGLLTAWRQARVLLNNGGPDHEAWNEHAIFGDDPAVALAFAKSNPGANIWDALASTETQVAFQSAGEQAERLARIAYERKHGPRVNDGRLARTQNIETSDMQGDDARLLSV